MTPARKVFFGVLGAAVILGLLMGLLNVVAPDASSVSMNGEELEGWGSVPVAMGIWGVMGLIFGLIAAGITALFTRKKKA